MTKADIINEVSELTGLTKVETEAVFEGVILSISNALKRQDRVDIRGFGSFQVKKRKARDARNPATQELLRLKERYVPVFKVSNLLKNEINKNI
tara:strand:+ start:1915 stop:2196 length:282 start_codon:yes stop_codon:yes gene_type:complete